jgi:Carboxypeptidase regulatory-like domain
MTGSMRWPLIAAVALTVGPFFGSVPHAQNRSGTISGTITDPQGGILPAVFIQAQGAKGTEPVSGSAGADGKYKLEAPAGTYELTVNVPGMKVWRRNDVIVRAGEAVHLDIRVEDGVSLRTLGEDPASIVATYFNRPDSAKGPPPRLADGTVDLSGVWLGGPADLSSLPLLPWAEGILKERTDNNLKDWPATHCLPAGSVPFFSGGFFKLVHHPTTLVLILENATGFTQMLLDGRTHPASFGPSWLGHSVGRWEGDTLVIDSIGFRDRGWLSFQGHPHSDQLHLTQRLRRVDFGHLDIEITLDDAVALQRPATVTKGASLAPEVELTEFICNENNRDVPHMVGR